MGGLISGPGTGTSDSIVGLDRRGTPTAMVSNGEFVINAQATRKNRELLEQINAGANPNTTDFGGYYAGRFAASVADQFSVHGGSIAQSVSTFNPWGGSIAAASSPFNGYNGMYSGGGSNLQNASTPGSPASPASALSAPQPGLSSFALSRRALGGIIGNVPRLNHGGEPELFRANGHSATQTPLNGGRGQIIQHYHMAVHVRATDAQSIKRSRGQIEQQMASSLRRAGSRLA